jgi:hypothetical protein
MGQGGDVMKALSKCAAVARIAFGAAVLMAAQLGPALAAPSIVQGHYEELVTTSCSGGYICFVYFTAVPAGDLLVVNSASCNIQVVNSPASLGLQAVYLASSPNQGAKVVDVGQFWLPPTPVMSTQKVKDGMMQVYQAAATGISKTYQAAEVPMFAVNMRANRRRSQCSARS